MKLVADEGVDKPIIDALRAVNFHVTYFAEEAPGEDDSVILAVANEAETLLLTCDKDFGELVYRQRLTTAGVLLIRLAGLASRSCSSMLILNRGRRRAPNAEPVDLLIAALCCGWIDATRLRRVAIVLT